MRICPSCRAVFPSGTSVCPDDGLALIEYSVTFPLAAAGGQPAPLEAPMLAPPGDDTDIRAGMMVGDYRVEGVIAHGGMGVIYAAVHPLISKRVAIKVLSRRYAQDSEQIARFMLEARAVNQIGHHNIVDIFAIGELNDGRRYLVMEFLDGLELNRVLANAGRFEPGEILPIYEQLCDALAAAHAKGFVHRDLKPENVTVLRRHPYPFIKILDFGIAKLRGTEQTAVGTVLGTPEYMAPEQCRAGPIDARVDVYALGVMLYELVTGKKPFYDPDPLRMLALQTKQQPKRPSAVAPVSSALEQVVLKAIEKHPTKRHQSVLELITELRAAIPQALPWTASLDPPEAADSVERTRTLQPDGPRAATPSTEQPRVPEHPAAPVRSIRASPKAAPKHDTDRTDLRRPAPSAPALAGHTRRLGDHGGEFPTGVDDKRLAQLADSRALTPLALTSGNLVDTLGEQKTTANEIGDTTVSLAKFATPPGSSSDMQEATVVDLRTPLKPPTGQGAQAKATAGSDGQPAQNGAQPGARSSAPTPTAIDYLPPQLEAASAEQPARTVVTGMIDEEATERRPRPSVRPRPSLHGADTELGGGISHRGPDPESDDTSGSTTLEHETPPPGPAARPDAYGATDLHNIGTTLPMDQPPAEAQPLGQLASIEIEDAEEDDARATIELPQMEDGAAASGPSLSTGPQRATDTLQDSKPPMYVQDETTHHVRNSGSTRLGATAIAFLVVLGAALLVGVLLLLTTGI